MKTSVNESPAPKVSLIDPIDLDITGLFQVN